MLIFITKLYTPYIIIFMNTSNEHVRIISDIRFRGRVKYISMYFHKNLTPLSGRRRHSYNI